MANQISRIVFAILLLAQLQVNAAEVFGPPLPPPPTAQPVFYCPEPNWEWGACYESELLTHSYPIYNKGGKTLKLLSVKPSCGCTTANYTETIAPNGKGEIKIKLNTAHYRDKLMKKIVRVYTNDPKHNSVVLHMSGKVKAVVTTEPSYPSVEALRGKEASTTVTLTNNMPDPLEIVSVKGQKEKFTAIDLKEVKPGNEFRLQLGIDTKKTASRIYYDKITVAAKDKRGKTYNIPLNFRVKLVDTINITPKYLTFRQYMLQRYINEKTGRPERSAILKGWKDNNFKITKVEITEFKSAILPVKTNADEGKPTESPIITATVDNDTVKSEYKLTVAVTSTEHPEKKRYVRYNVIIHTDDKMTPKLKVLVTVYFPRETPSVSTGGSRTTGTQKTSSSSSTSPKTPHPSTARFPKK